MCNDKKGLGAPTLPKKTEVYLLQQEFTEYLIQRGNKGHYNYLTIFKNRLSKHNHPNG